MKNLNVYLSFLKSLTNHIVKAVFFLFLFNGYLFAQTNDTKKNTLEDSVFVMQKSPWGAVLRSALLPGLGQIYNESYIKAPIIWGGLTALVLGWRFYDKRYANYKDIYSHTGLSKYKDVRDFYRDQRDLMSIYIALVYVLNLVDAYVDAQLFDFNVQENYQTHQTMLGIKLNF
jgi:Family of unknown function (DUF5683)